MRKVGAIVRASWLISSSYRLNMVLTVASLIATVIPVYFIAGALQPTIAEHIQAEGGNYFAFVLVGLATFSFLGVAVNSIPRALGSGISSGTLEVMLSTPTPVSTLLAGFVSYDLLWSTARNVVLLSAGVVLGAQLELAQLATAIALIGLTVLSYLPFGLLGAALILVFRTSGPLARAVTTVSALLGGVYYPTTVIPSWLEDVSGFIPLTYGLRAVRRTLLDGERMAAVLDDVLILAAMTAVLLAVGSAVFVAALRYARRTGTLGHY